MARCTAIRDREARRFAEAPQVPPPQIGVRPWTTPPTARRSTTSYERHRPEGTSLYRLE
jgi:hypothetical protein